MLMIMITVMVMMVGDGGRWPRFQMPQLWILVSALLGSHAHHGLT